jgi:hypothetical protein
MSTLSKDDLIKSNSRLTNVICILVVVMIFVLVHWCYKYYHERATAVSSIYGSMSLEQSGVKDGDILETRDGNYTQLWYVRQAINEGNEYQDRLILENPAFIHGSDGMRSWWAFRKWIIAAYHKGEPGYDSKANQYINQPR